ncbi:MAG: hypothetical protein AAFQ64_21350 [Pseudomonadota bacterium]
MNLKTHILGPALLALIALPGMGHAATLLSIDLSVQDEITINAEPGLATVSATGTDFTGFYLENFYSGPGIFPTATLVSGNLTTANQTSDNSPQLWRGGGTDLGLNIWSFAVGNTTSVTAGQQAFSGSATWSVSNAVYNDLLSGGGTFGNIYLNADTVDDIAGATLIGEFAISPVPLPAPVLLLGTVLLAAGLYGRRRNSFAKA